MADGSLDASVFDGASDAAGGEGKGDGGGVAARLPTVTEIFERRIGPDDDAAVPQTRVYVPAAAGAVHSNEVAVWAKA